MTSRFSKELLALRVAHHLSQSALAERLGVDRSRISRVENGDPPSMHFIERINEEFGINSMEWLDENVLEETVVKRMSVVHMDTRDSADNAKWRDKALELLTRMTELLETMIRNSRGGSS